MAAAELQRLRDRDRRTEFKRILLIGESGTGKTQFIGTMPKPFIADFDRGLTTIAGHETAVSKDFSGEGGWDDFMKEVQAWRKDGPQYDCETFALDSLTCAADACMTSIMAAKGSAGAQPGIAEWGAAIRKVKDLMGYLTTLRCHVIVNAHLEITKDEVLGGMVYQPMIFGKELPGKLPIYFDEVWVSDVQVTTKGGEPETTYRMQVMPDQRIRIVKSRLADSGTFKKYVAPDFATIINTPRKGE
ncbi:MAG TPA: AAA family ATPase [Candidatus Heimdallarchaeota archaeon]|nr:AAA family ATPase [Candidatus Heimdallarchaeota archaeon]